METIKIGILGTGMVGRAHAAKLSSLGHNIVIGTQDIEKTNRIGEKDSRGNQSFRDWHREFPKIKLATFAEAAIHGHIIFNALKGEVALEVLKKLEPHLDSKIIIDISNPLDFSKGMPPSLFISNTDSLGEQIQKALPSTKVVKTFNTLTANLQVEPLQLANGDHHLFLSGNDADAKAKVTEIAKSYGWKNIFDLGDIRTARAAEMILPVWIVLWGKLQNPMFNLKIVMKNK